MGNAKGFGTSKALTFAQREFTERVVLGESPSLAAAYRSCYSQDKSNSKQLGNSASRLWKHPGVKAYALELRKKLQEQKLKGYAQERQRITRRLWIEATPKSYKVEHLVGCPDGIGEKGSDRISALRLLGIEVEMFDNKGDTLDSTYNESSQAELIEEIRLALQNSSIDVTPKSDSVLVEDDLEIEPLELEFTTIPSIKLVVDNQDDSRNQNSAVPRGEEPEGGTP